MKIKYMLSALFIAVIFSLVGCGSSENDTNDANNSGDNIANDIGRIFDGNYDNNSQNTDNVYDGYGYGIRRDDSITGHSALGEYYDPNFPNYAENGVPDAINDYEALSSGEITTNTPNND